MKYLVDQLNFAVGPVMIDPDILKLGANQVPYFRTPEFSKLMLENEAMMKKLVNAQDSARTAFITGSGTAAMEAAVINMFGCTDSLLIINGGSFGKRFCEICKIHSIPYAELNLSYGEILTSYHLKPYEKKGYTGFLVNMHETSTGVLYDMTLISDFCKRNNLFLVVDAISSFLADSFSMRDYNADIVITGSQKALAVPPGISILVINQRAVTRIYSKRTACMYLDLKAALTNGERGQTPFTPAVGILLQIHKKFEAILNYGVENELARIQELAMDFRRKIVGFPFNIFSSSLSNALTPLSPSNGKSAKEIYELLKQDYNIIVCPSGGELSDILIRVGHMGALTTRETDILIEAFRDMQKRGLL